MKKTWLSSAKTEICDGVLDFSPAVISPNLHLSKIIVLDFKNKISLFERCGSKISRVSTTKKRKRYQYEIKDLFIYQNVDLFIRYTKEVGNNK